MPHARGGQRLEKDARNGRGPPAEGSDSVKCGAQADVSSEIQTELREPLLVRNRTQEHRIL